MSPRASGGRFGISLASLVASHQPGTFPMQRATDRRPELSYVLSATTAEEVHKAALWLRTTRLSDQVEIVLAAPGKAFGRIAGRLIPPWVRLASAEDTPDRRLIQVAGARQTTGAVVIVVSCGDDLDAKVRDPFGGPAGPADGGEDPHLWAADSAAQLPPVVGDVSFRPIDGSSGAA